jgi:DNA primase
MWCCQHINFANCLPCSVQLLENFRNTEQGKQLAKLMCWQHHIDADAAQDVFLDSIEKLLNKFVEQRTEVLLQKARLGQMTLREKQELQALLNA